MVLPKKVQFTFWIIGLYVFTLCLHLVVFSAQATLPDQTYEQFRHLDAIEKTGKPLFTDELSKGKTVTSFNPLSYYVIYPLWAVSDSINQFLMFLITILSVIPLFLFTLFKKNGESTKIALSVSLFAGINPLILSLYQNGLFLVGLFIPFTILFFIAFFSFKEYKSSWLKTIQIIFLTVLCIVSPHFSFALCIILIFIGIHYFEKRDFSRSQKELCVYLILVYFLTQYIIFQLFFTGSTIATSFVESVFQQMLNIYFFEVFAQLSIPFLCVGLWSFYRSFRMRTNTFVLFAFCLFAGSLFLFLLQVNHAFLLLIYAFLALLITVPYLLHFLDQYWKSSKLSKHAQLFRNIAIIFLSLYVIAFVIPFLFGDNSVTLTDDETQLFEWVSQTTSGNSLFFIDPANANKFSLFTSRATFVDTSSTNSPSGKKRLATQTKLYETLFESVALETIGTITNEYAQSYLVWDLRNQNKPGYLGGNCFTQTYANAGFEIYLIGCLEEKNA